MKTSTRFARPPAYIPPMRTPFQDYEALQRRRARVARLGMFAVGLVVLLATLGHLGA